MATYFQSIEQIQQADRINGLTFPEVEKRARPDAHALSGFIGPNETLKEVLIEDWKTVASLGTTHIELASHLSAISNKSTNLLCPQLYDVTSLKENSLQKKKLDFVERICTSGGMLSLGLITLGSVIVAVSCVFASWFSIIGIIVGGTLAIWKSITLFFLSSPQLKIVFNQSRGYQEDLFQNNTPEDVFHWDSEWSITNQLTGKSVLVTHGVIEYIKKYGFYEGGGDTNPYRIDPKKLIEILTEY